MRLSDRAHLRLRQSQSPTAAITSPLDTSNALSTTASTDPDSASTSSLAPSSLFSSNARSFTSQTETTPASTAAFSTTFDTPTFSSIVTTFITSSSPSPSTSTPPPSSSSPPSYSTPSSISSALSSGFVLSTFTSSFVTEIDGSSTTIVTPIATALRTPASSRSSSRTSIIAGAAVAGLALLIMALATVFFLRKRKRRRQPYWSLSRGKRLPSRSTFLVGEEMDLPIPSPPVASLDQPDPFTTLSSRRDSSAVGSIGSGGAPVYPHPRFSRSQSDSSSRGHTLSRAPLLPPPPSSAFTPPRLLRARASESGSIFQESVWPPPAALTDPLTYPSQSVNLTRIVTDVMGPPETDPLPLLPPGSSPEQEQEQGVPEPDGEEGERRGSMDPRPLSNLVITNLDILSPQSDLQSPSLMSPPSSPPEPLLPPELEPEPPHPPPSPPPWLSRPLNPSPRSSPLSLQRTQPS